jgi:hypothetical protein
VITANRTFGLDASLAVNRFNLYISRQNTNGGRGRSLQTLGRVDLA